MELIARGRTAEVYSYGAHQVIKLLYPWCPADWAQREAEAAERARSQGLPVPRCEGVVERHGRKGIIFEKIEGPSLLSEIIRKPWTMRRQWGLLADVQARIHSQPGDGFPALDEYLGRRISASQWIPEDLKQRVRARLAGLSNGSSLCHFDFHPGQVILSRTGPVVLDWMSAFRGAAAADIARTMVLMTFTSPPERTLAVRAGIRFVRKSFQRSYTDDYLRVSPGLDRGAVDKWMIPVAAARLGEQIENERALLLAFLEERLRPVVA